LELPLVRDRPRFSFALVAATVAALGLSACGRNGGLELPPGPATPQPAAATPQPSPGESPGGYSTSEMSGRQTAAKTGFDAQGNPVAGPGQKKDFFLDWLLK